VRSLTVTPTSSDNYHISIDSKRDFSNILPYIKHKKVLIVTNTTIEKLYLKPLLDTLSVDNDAVTCILDDGEMFKSQDSLTMILNKLLENNFTRASTVIIALGGGVIGDITGFAASIYQRGVDFIQIPTTLLSQVDSSVGGKTAINHTLGKNMIGSFYQPKFVYTSIEFYKTLPEREYISGLAEVVKYGFISQEFYNWLEDNRQDILSKNTDTLIEMIIRSCSIKAQVVAEDEKEITGTRAILNFGHTFAHAIEKCQKYQGLKHGEAVGVGMRIAVEFSYHLGLIDKQTVTTLITFIKSFNISTIFPDDIDTDTYLNAMLLDKKNTKDTLRFILVSQVGDLRLIDVDKKLLEDFVK
jgi:3-dehydroquinate synthase